MAGPASLRAACDERNPFIGNCSNARNQRQAFSRLVEDGDGLKYDGTYVGTLLNEICGFHIS